MELDDRKATILRAIVEEHISTAQPVGSQTIARSRNLGVSSATVERMAREQACSGGLGAGLITQTGPVEVYRMQCDNGKVFMARCELRQCKRM